MERNADEALITSLRALAHEQGDGATASLSVHAGEAANGSREYSYTVSLAWSPDDEGNPREMIAYNRGTPREALQAVITDLRDPTVARPR